MKFASFKLGETQIHSIYNLPKSDVVRIEFAFSIHLHLLPSFLKVNLSVFVFETKLRAFVMSNPYIVFEASSLIGLW